MKENRSREDHKLARPNYQGEKRRKDLAKKAKKEEKRLRKLHAKENPTLEDDEAARSLPTPATRRKLKNDEEWRGPSVGAGG